MISRENKTIALRSCSCALHDNEDSLAGQMTAKDVKEVLRLRGPQIEGLTFPSFFKECLLF